MVYYPVFPADASWQLTADKELLIASIPLAVGFTKHLGGIFMPSSSQESAAKPTPAQAASVPSDSVDQSVSITQKEKFRKLLTAYYDALSRRAVREHTVSL